MMKRMTNVIVELSEQIQRIYDEDPLVEKARNTAIELHGRGFYFGHLIRVVKIGLVGLDEQGFSDDEVRDLICSFLLHDTPEDIGVSFDYMKREFNERIAVLTFEVKKNPITGEFPRLQSYFGYVVKLADRFANFTSGYLRDRHPAKIVEYQSTLKHAFDTKQKSRI